ncbi:MAG: thioredoxin-dependent thiol peroxidase [Anaerolineae bacterium]
MVTENELAPDFTLLADDGESVTLSTFRGRKVVLYFYPKDDTPGCTTEACSFRDDYSQFLMKGAVVIGVSPDDAASHGQFRAKFGLPFYLLSDTDHKVASLYGAWGEKKLYGKSYEGIIRSTFIIGEDGQVIKAFSKVKVEGHAQQVLQYLG